MAKHLLAPESMAFARKRLDLKPVLAFAPKVLDRLSGQLGDDFVIAKNDTNLGAMGGAAFT